MREIRKVLNLVLICLFVAGLPVLAERLIWANADSYPMFLAKEISASVAGNTTEDRLNAATLHYFEEVCAGHRRLMSIVTKDNGTFLRCDDGFSSWKNGVYRVTFGAHTIG